MTHVGCIISIQPTNSLGDFMIPPNRHERKQNRKRFEKMAIVDVTGEEKEWSELTAREKKAVKEKCKRTENLFYY
ncbi:hypothetical protein CALK_2001 [Chitinivibrio alkaliphilus ACht1]|uniref:Uncharacterized protein n=2 Tax=Chitinivibrio TaxID=1505231 RepID=U7D9M8_9BACT|nr:hypothetical protein CALK_2001 [Chitinivibrio alkaliphilus ACht1]